MTPFVARFLERTRASALAVWLTGCGVYFLAVLHRSSLGVAGPDAMERWHISSAQLGIFVMLQLGIYAFMQVPAGLLIDRWGPRRVLLAATLVAGSAQLLFAFSGSYPVALLARGVLGAGDAAVYLSVLRLAAMWFPRRRYAVLTMWSGLFGMAGNLAATLPLTLALAEFGWVRTFAVTGAVSVAYSVLLLRPAVAAPYREPVAGAGVGGAGVGGAGVGGAGAGGAGGGAGEGAAPGRGVRGVLAEVAASWRGGDLGRGTQVGFWTHQATMASGTVFAMVWGFPYLTGGLGYSANEAAGMLLVLGGATVAFSFVVGPYAGRRRGARMPLALVICGAILLAWAVLLLWPGGQPPRIVVMVVLVVIAVGGPGSQIGFHLARDYSPQHRISTATGIVNTGGFIAAMVGAVSVGVILDARSGDLAPTLLDYRWALASIAFLTAASTLALVISLLQLRRSTLARISAGQDVALPVVAHWWDGAGAHRDDPSE